MATSGVTTFSVNRNQILYQALYTIGVISPIETPNAQMITMTMRVLNMIVKQWQGSADFAPGLKVWSRKRATLFLQKGQHQYSLGPSGDHATASYTSTTLAAGAATSATSLTVASIAGLTTGQYIGILLDSGTIHWTTINGAPSGVTVVITTGLASAAASGATVYAYTSKITRPLELLTVSLRNTSDIDWTLDPMSQQEYDGLGNKSVTAVPSRYLYETTLTNGTLFYDASLSTANYRSPLVYYRPIEDFVDAADDADYPQVWFRPLVYQLAIDLAPSYTRPVTQEMRDLLRESLAIAQRSDPENVTAFFEPEAC